MSERYSKLFSLPENLYTEGSPVIIAAGALLKDNSTGKLLVQLKFRNISDCVINAVKVKINAFDPAGTVLKGVESFSYLDLSVGKDGEFGQKKPIPLSDVTTRSFSVQILSVTYSGGIYTPKEKEIAAPAEQEVLEAIQALNQGRVEKREKQERKEKSYKDIINKFSLWSVLLLILSSISYVYRWCIPQNIIYSPTPNVIIDLVVLIGMLICIRLSPKIRKAPVIGIVFVAIMIILETGFFSFSRYISFSDNLWLWKRSWLDISLYAIMWYRLVDIKNIVSVVILIIFNKKIKALEETYKNEKI